MSETFELELAWAPVAAVGDDHRRAAVVGEDVIGRYRQPHRRYHSVSHLVWVTRHITTLTNDPTTLGPVDTAVAFAAAFFHDAIYDPHADAGCNEERSAALATIQLQSFGWPAERVADIAAIIRATAGHLDDGGGEVAATTAVVLDADLAILGADARGYQAYATGVRAEYGHLDDATWRAGRSTVVEALAARRPLYRTPGARLRWEDAAHANLAAELASLRAR